MKPCKGCCYFRRTPLDSQCDYNAVYTRSIDELSLDVIHRMVGCKDAEYMRSNDGECGPDRKLYDTNTNQFKRWIKKRLHLFNNDI